MANGKHPQVSGFLRLTVVGLRFLLGGLGVGVVGVGVVSLLTASVFRVR